MVVQTKTAVIAEKKMIAQNVLEVRLLCDEAIEVRPGQHILLRMGDFLRPFTAIPDSYSLKLIIKLVKDTITQDFFSKVSIGDCIEIEGPHGNAVESIYRDAVFVATGTGIVPVVAVVKYLLESGTPHQICIIFGIRNQEELFYAEELPELDNEYSNCKVTIVMSRPCGEWFGQKGRVSDYIEENFNDFRDVEFYICGNEQIANSVAHRLNTLGVPKHRYKHLH